MEGFNSAEERGIIPRAIEQIFKHIQTTLSPRMRFLVRASYLQIYNEVISDLLKPERTNLVIREDKKKVPCLCGREGGASSHAPRAHGSARGRVGARLGRRWNWSGGTASAAAC